MKFILLVEGDTERRVLPSFLRRCFEPLGFDNLVGFSAVNMGGWSNLYKDVAKKAHTYLSGPLRHPSTIGVVSLLDLYGPDFYPSAKSAIDQRVAWIKQDIEAKVGNHDKFRHFCAVHELEAWLLSQSDIFPSGVRESVAALGRPPEKVNFQRPPKQWLDDVYEKHLKRSYQQVIHGDQLFSKLQPAIARQRCPYFDQMIEELAAMAKAAGA